MIWQAAEPKCGDIIRIELSTGLYHYGIYISDDEVIAFGLPPIGGFSVPSEEIKVLSTDIEHFYCGRFLEVAKLTFAEKFKAKKPAAVAAYARSRIGVGGYHIVKNNCEHFVYECVFGVKKSAQADAVAGAVKSMAQSYVYVAQISDVTVDTQLFPPERMKEIEECTNDKVKRQKYAVWRLLSFALSDALSVDIEKTDVHKEPNGKWVCSDCCFSLSHTDGLVAVAVAREPIGVDIERLDRTVNTAAIRKSMTKAELKHYAEHDTPRDMVMLWTKKESAFKRAGEADFKPTKIDTLSDGISSFCLTELNAALSLAFDGGRIELFEVTDNFSVRKPTKFSA